VHGRIYYDEETGTCIYGGGNVSWDGALPEELQRPCYDAQLEGYPSEELSEEEEEEYDSAEEYRVEDDDLAYEWGEADPEGFFGDEDEEAMDDEQEESSELP
jgi:hypothetical protein